MVFIWCVGEHEECLNKCITTLFICTFFGKIVETNVRGFQVGLSV